jgi:antitoxin (DNA-binding transcriptional repressor) of toxin-antitoxin stability system
MRSVSTRQLQDDFAGILRILREGEEIELVDRKRKIARIVPTRRARKSADCLRFGAGSLLCGETSQPPENPPARSSLSNAGENLL